MTTYNTGNPLGSADPRDLYDNAENLDNAVNSTANEWTDRLGVERKTWAAIEQGIEEQLIAGGQIFPDEPTGRAAVTNGQYFYAESDDPNVSRTLWRRVSSSASDFIADDPSAELVYAALQAAANAGLAGEFPGDDGFNPLYAVSDDQGNTLFHVDENAEFRSKPLFEFPADDSEEVYAIVDEDGRILLSFDENGELMQGTGGAVGSGRSAMMPYPYEGTLRGSGDDDYHIADLGQYNALSIHQGGSRSVRAVIDRPSIGPTTAVTGFVDGDVLVPDNPNVLHIVIGLGQSLMIGLRSENTLITTEQPYPNDVYMFDVGPNSDVRMGAQADDWSLDGDTIRGLRPLVAVSNGSSGQTPLESMGTALARYCRESDNVQTRRLFFVAARGGQAYDNLRKGTTVYTNMLTALQRAKEVAEAEGWRVVVDCAVLRHGEAGDPTPEATYKDALLQWQSDVDADVKAITGQMSDVPFLICQQSSHFGTTRPPITAMAELHAENSLFSVVAPDYPILDLYDPDLLHGLGGFYFINGEYLDRAFRQTVWGNGGKNKITRILSAARTGTTVDLQYEVPVAPLVFDSSVSERDFRGFRYVDSAGDVTIIGAAIIDSGSDGVGVVRLTLGSAPSGTDERVSYAMTGHSGTRELSTVPRGQLRDSAGNNERSRFDNRPLHNWAIHQSVEVTA